MVSGYAFCIPQCLFRHLDRSIKQQDTEESVFGTLWNLDEKNFHHARGNDPRFRGVALIVHKYTKPGIPKVLNYVTKYLESFRIHYVTTRTDDRLLVDLKYEMTKDIKKAKYSLIIFYEFQTFLTLSPLARDVINNYCAKFKTGQIFFAGNNYGKISTFGLEVRRLEKDRQYNLHVNPSSRILWMTKPGVEAGKVSRTRLSYIQVRPSDPNYETVAYFMPSRHSGDVGEGRKVAMLLDDGKVAGFKRIFTTLGAGLFLNGLLFLDALKYLSVLPSKYTLKRYIQVDIDDIFIGKTGLRLKTADVKVGGTFGFSVKVFMK